MFQDFTAHWLHRAAKHSVEGPIGLPLTSSPEISPDPLLALLDGCTPLRDRILSAAADLRSNYSWTAPIELYLPLLDRLEWKMKADVLADCQVDALPGGQIVVRSNKHASPELAEVTLTLAAQSVLTGAGNPETYRLTHSIPVDGASVRIAEHYGQTVSPGARTLTVAVPGTALTVWTEAPRESTARYFPVYRVMSMALQRALRVWLPVTSLASIERLEDLEFAYAMLAYAATPVFTPQSRSQLTYDVLSPKAFHRMYRSVKRGIVPFLRHAHARLIAAGRPDIAVHYQARKAPDIFEELKNRPRPLHRLLTIDGDVVNWFVKFGLRCAELTHNPEMVNTFARGIAHDVNIRIRRGVIHDQPGLPIILMIEATAALENIIRGKGEIFSGIRH